MASQLPSKLQNMSNYLMSYLFWIVWEKIIKKSLNKILKGFQLISILILTSQREMDTTGSDPENPNRETDQNIKFFLHCPTYGNVHEQHPHILMRVPDAAAHNNLTGPKTLFRTYVNLSGLGILCILEAMAHQRARMRGE